MPTNNATTTTSYRGMRFLQLLTITFIVLKLVGYITWSWWWVLAPLWIPVSIALLILIGVGIFVLIAALLAK